MMKFLLTVMQGTELIKQAVMDSGDAIASAILEVLQGNDVSLRLWNGGELVDYRQFNFDTRFTQTIN
jgi:hypothetical protein